jgi:hypothetical protein
MTNTTTMTQREMLTEVIANETISAQAKAKAQEMLTKLDERNEARKGVQSKKSAENAVLREVLYNYLTTLENPIAVKELMEKIDEVGFETTEEMTKGKVTALLTRLVADERVKRETIKKVNYYSVA